MSVTYHFHCGHHFPKSAVKLVKGIATKCPKCGSRLKSRSTICVDCSRVVTMELRAPCRKRCPLCAVVHKRAYNAARYQKVTKPKIKLKPEKNRGSLWHDATDRRNELLTHRPPDRPRRVEDSW